MTEHPITPPPELVQQWVSEFYGTTIAPGEASIAIATQAARWGADQELEACCEWLVVDDWKNVSENLRAARRPKPPSLKEEALNTLDEMSNCMGAGFIPKRSDLDTIRRALEALPE